MNQTKKMLTAAAVGCLLTASAFASTSTAAYLEKYKVVRTDIPLPAKVVTPTLPARYKDQTAQLTMMVDPAGRPHDIALVGRADPELAALLIPAVSQWQFTPAYDNGVAVSRRIMLPLRFVGES
jgi:hypothetical protein